MYQFTCTEQKEPDYGEVHESLQNCRSSLWNLFHITLLLPRNWRWLLDFWEVCGLYCWRIGAGSVYQTLSSTLSLSCINFLFAASLNILFQTNTYIAGKGRKISHIIFVILGILQTCKPKIQLLIWYEMRISWLYYLSLR